ncbi:MAG: sulfatase-like hydrolase/transferase, partial [Planctomycetota bacterium]|nr:sulfatase-like hydrolase/transferase [Planctomycetota bacterium]
MTCFAALAAEPPNVVIILADDLGYGDVGANNPDSRIPTPAMDRVAAEGIRFTDGHSPS